ncbi:MAG: hypothetical protein EOP49_18905 [Sphingobacteriales bacterium]|nr:MAG: hypothetical protein EOP49_18905 [Sphingobacteriales bacterium]
MSERIEKLKSFLAQSPEDSFLNHALALEYIKAGHDSEARLLFESTMRREPGYVATYYHLGKLLERSGDSQAAISTYEAGMEIAKAAGDQHSYNELRGAYEDLVY